MDALIAEGHFVPVRLDVIVGIDVGQKSDPTALAAVERPEDGRFLCRHLERLPLGTPYPRVADRLRTVYENLNRLAQVRNQERYERALYRSGWRDPDLTISVYLDATGVGQPIADLLAEAGVPVIPCYFTHGDRRAVERDRVSVGKAWLVSRLQALLQTRRLQLPGNHPEAAALRSELLDYEIRIDQNANDRYGAFKTGTHDDLVTAVGLACQEDAGTVGMSADLIDYLNAQVATQYPGW